MVTNDFVNIHSIPVESVNLYLHLTDYYNEKQGLR